MKKPNIVRLSLALASLVAVTIAFGQDPRPVPTVGGRLQGTWDMQITLTDCSGHTIRSFASLVVFMAGGTVTEASAGTAPALQTGGKVFGAIPLTVTTRFASKTSRLTLPTCLRAG